MAKTKQQKEEIVKELSDRFGKTKTVIFTNFDGLNVQDTTELRKVLRENSVDYTVVKRTLVNLALKSAELKEVDISSMDGGIGIATGYEDEILPAKVLATFAKGHKELKLVGGIFDGQFMDDKKVMELAMMPGKQELYGKLVWLLNYPASGLVNVLSGNTRKLVYVLNAIKEKIQ
ncbi:MAG: 50S ribosomal protein L10 [bacterium]|nr:50S ribosomal protein L10 [bacterium]